MVAGKASGIWQVKPCAWAASKNSDVSCADCVALANQASGMAFQRSSLAAASIASGIETPLATSSVTRAKNSAASMTAGSPWVNPVCARAAVIILDNATAAERVVNLLHRKFPKLNIYVCAHDNAHKRRLTAAGTSGIVQETYELSLHLGETVLCGYGTPDEQIQEIIRDHRADDYALLSDVILPVTVEKDGQKT